jgi:hypothetical protein
MRVAASSLIAPRSERFDRETMNDLGKSERTDRGAVNDY